MNYFLTNREMTIIVSDLGAELQSIRRKDGREDLWQGDPSVWGRRSPLLFPVVGKLKDDQFIYQGQKYTMPKHGFAMNSVFEADASDPSRLLMTLRNSPDTLRHFPFPFELSLTYTLEGRTLRIRYAVRNPAETSMYFSIGAHPALACSLGDKLVFEQKETAGYRWLNAGGDMLLSRESRPFFQQEDTLVLTEETFAHDAMIFDSLRSRFVTLIRRDGSGVRAGFGGAPVLGLWARQGASYVCVEPWFGLDDTADVSGRLTEKPGIVALEGGKTFEFAVTLELI